MIDSKTLKSAMLLAGVDAKKLANELGWKCTATAYRKINGTTPFTATEIQACKDLLCLAPDAVMEIFFPSFCPKSQI